MKSAIAKYDHVVQCLQELKQTYRNAEMFETVLSPRTVNFTQSGLYVRSHAIYKSCQKWQSFFRMMWWESMETEAWSLRGRCLNCSLWSQRMSEGCFHTGFVGFQSEPKLGYLLFCICNCLLTLVPVLKRLFASNAWIQIEAFHFANDGQSSSKKLIYESRFIKFYVGKPPNFYDALKFVRICMDVHMQPKVGDHVDCPQYKNADCTCTIKTNACYELRIMIEEVAVRLERCFDLYILSINGA